MKKYRYARIEQVMVLTLTFQSGKFKYITGIFDRDNLETRADQLNNLLKEQSGFPSEHFAEPLTPHWLDRDPMRLKLKIIFGSVAIVILLVLLILIVTEII